MAKSKQPTLAINGNPNLPLSLLVFIFNCLDLSNSFFAGQIQHQGSAETRSHARTAQVLQPPTTNLPPALQPVNSVQLPAIGTTAALPSCSEAQEDNEALRLHTSTSDPRYDSG